MGKKIASVFIALVLVVTCVGCQRNSELRNDKLDQEKAVTLKVAGAKKDFQALENFGRRFTEQFPNCQIEYEYLQDYGNTVVKRLNHEDSDIDLFMTDNIQQDSAVLPYAMELFSQSDKFCLDDTFEGLIKSLY